MATNEDKQSFGQALGEALSMGAMAFGDSVSGIYGQRGNTYATYLDSQMKRKAMEVEAQKYQIEQASKMYNEQQDAISKYAGYGMRPITRTDLPRTPSKSVSGPYGMNFVPDKGLIDAKRSSNSIFSNMPLTEKISMLEGMGLPPGSTVYDKATGARVPINRVLTQDESAAVAGEEKFSALTDEITGLIDKGTLKNGKNKAWSQWLAEGGDSPIRRFLTADDTDLEALASARSEMYKYAFSEGGKQLTETEKKTVGAGLSFVGKSDKQIKKDFTRAVDILRAKGKLALGGTVEARKMKQNAGIKEMSEDELRKLAGL